MLRSVTNDTIVILLEFIMTVKRSTVSFQPPVWEQLSQAKNKSEVVNQALKLYFSLSRFEAQKNLEYTKVETEFLLQEYHHFKLSDEKYEYEEVFNRECRP